MWGLTEPDEIVKRIRDMMERTVQGEIIPFDEWEDVKADMEEEIDLWNEAPEGLTREEGMEMAMADRTAFLALLERLGLSLDNRLQFCYDLRAQAQEHPSLELLEVFCVAVSGSDFLLDKELPCPIEDEYLQQWGTAKEDAEILYEHLTERKKQADRFAEVLKELCSYTPPRSSGVPQESAEQEQIFQIYTQLFDIADDEAIREKLLGNIAWLLSVADSSEVLTAVKPLFLYRMLTRHGKRLQNNTDLRINFRALWGYQSYILEENGNKNDFQKLLLRDFLYLELFSQLCGVFEEDEAVDLPLCVCGFDHLSNLGELYRMGATEGILPATWVGMACDVYRLGAKISFGPSMEDIMLDSMFLCYPSHKYKNLIAVDSGIRSRQLEKFRKDIKNFPALEKISDYANENIEDLLRQFLKVNQDLEKVKAFCEDVLEASQLSEEQKPKTPQETALFSAALYDELTSAVELVADDFLLQAGCALIGDRYP